MVRVLPAFLELALLVFCLIDCVQTDSLRVRNLSKTWWIVLIVVLPLVGGIAWLVAGRPERTARREGVWYSERTGFPEQDRPVGPSAADIDARTAREQARVDAEHEAAVRRAQAKARRPDGA